VSKIIDLPKKPRRSRTLVVFFAVLGALSLGGGRLLSLYLDALWFNSLGYAEVFRKTLALQSSLFGVAERRPT